MDFVGDDQRTAFLADVSYLTKLVHRPHTPARVVRIAEDERLASLHIATQAVEVDMIVPVAQVERRTHDLALQPFGNKEEGMVDGRHYQHTVARLRKAEQGKSLGTHNTRHKRQPIGAYLPLMALLQPAANGGIPTFTSRGISQHFMLQSMAQGIHHKRRRTKIHIGHPHSRQVVAPPNVLHTVPLHRIGAAAIYYFIEIILHFLLIYKVSLLYSIYHLSVKLCFLDGKASFYREENSAFHSARQSVP